MKGIKRKKLLGELQSGTKKKRREDSHRQVPRTIENSRVLDETLCQSNDPEIVCEDSTSEVSTRCAEPKVLITSSDRPSLKSHLLMKELSKCIPNSTIKIRRGIRIKKIIPSAITKGYTAILIVNEDRKLPNGLLMINLPEGPSAYFKLSSFKRGYEIKNHGRSTTHQPEVILNNFSTRLGQTIGHMLASLFPKKQQFKGRQVVTFHNQRDYIFFRYHRYIFRNAKRVGMQELGPRFTIKLSSLQKGTFDSMHGEYIWVHKKQDKKTRTKFYL